MKILKQTTIFIFVLAVLFQTTACSKQPQSQTSQPAQSQSQPTQPQMIQSQPAQEKSDELAAELLTLDGVVNVERIEQAPDSTDEYFERRYVVEFEQPISWNNPNLGTFRQRVFLGYRGKNNTNVFVCGGYCLKDVDNPEYLKTCSDEELSSHYDANYFDIEYRFFGKSVPEGLSTDSELYWEYLNSEEASKDFHHIITELKKVFFGSTIFTGASKGGYTTENMACYFPDDIDAYVSYVSPLCDSPDDARMNKNIYCTIGNETFGAELAKQHRDTLLEFQKLLLSEEYRNEIQKEFLDKFDGKDIIRSPLISDDEAYEIAVLEMSCAEWMYYQNFELYEKCLAMPDTDEKQHSEKIEAVKKVFYFYDPVGGINLNGYYGPYAIQAYTEMGHYLEDLSYLRQAGANIKTPQENDATLVVRSSAPLILNSSLKYTSAYRDRLLEFFKTTEKDIIKIYGKSDPWYAVRMPETGNPHIHIFEVGYSHLSKIDMLPENEKKACYDLIDSLLYNVTLVNNEDQKTDIEAA